MQKGWVGRLDPFSTLIPLLMAAAIVLAVILAFHDGAIEWFTEQKAWELTLQFLFVAVLGGGVALFYRDMERRRADKIRDQEREREHMEAQRTALEKFRQELIATHQSAKKIRRTLCAMAYSTDGGTHYSCERERYAQLMDQLEEAQLGTEALAAEVDARQDLFGKEHDRKALNDILNGAESYLRELLRHYENDYGGYKFKDDTQIQLTAKMADFIGSSKEGDPPRTVDIRYYDPLKKARKLVGRLIENNTPKVGSAGSNP
jgi:hypothetical protein